MSQDVEIQLKVWKDLAISKQILMDAATDALNLDAGCSTDELKQALDKAIKRARDADLEIQQTREAADARVAEFRQRAEDAERAQAEAEAARNAAVEARDQAERQLAAGKADNAEALKRARAEVADKQRELKAISKALADTPENVVRKLKTLKKQKLDEAKMRGQAEKSVQSLRKDKARLEAQVEVWREALEAAGKLADQAEKLHAGCAKAAGTIEKLSDKKKDRLEVPALDETALATIRQALS